MAKKKRRKSLLPKRIAGVKVPKAVRKGRFGELLASQTGRALLAEAVLAAGAIGAAKKAGDAVADKAAEGPSVRSFATGLAERLQHGDGKEAGAALAFALGEAARVFFNAIGEHRQGAASAAAAEAPDSGDSKKKPRPSQPQLR